MHAMPNDPRLPAAYRAQMRRENAAETQERALAFAREAGRQDALTHLPEAAQAWRDVEDLVGLPVPRVYHRARSAARREQENK